jgi:N-succinyldiaminopimelate aminotransferase
MIFPRTALPLAGRGRRRSTRYFAICRSPCLRRCRKLARDNNAINLGQGFPDDPGPEDIRRAAADAVMDGYNQYPSMMGLPELRQAIAAHYGRWHGLTLDPMTEVMVTSGGTEALTSAILAVVEPGDEVVAFQPVYDSYLPIIRQAGGIPRLVRLEPPHWRLTEEALHAVFNRKTKAVLFNNPVHLAPLAGRGRIAMRSG